MLLQNSIGAGQGLWAKDLGKLEISKPGKINAEGFFFFFFILCWKTYVLEC